MAKADKEGQRKAPILRFKGFTDDWEQRKLSSLGKIIAGGDKDSKKLKQEGKYPVIANNLENDGIIGYYENDYKVDAPAITITARGNIGNATARFVNFTPVVRLLVLKTNLNTKFIEQSINNIKFFIESTGVPQLTVPQLSNYSIFVPNKSEQYKIGLMFNQLDSLIALYDRKLKLLSQVKKYFLDNLFAEKEYPNLRFKGFTDAWEQRKLKELGNIKRGASPRPISDPKWFDENGKYGWLRISDVTFQNGQVFQIDQHLSSIGEEKTVLISSPHLIISIAATVGKPCINYIPTAIHDGFVAFLDYKFNLDFMFEWFNKNQNIWLKYGQPGAQINLNSSIIGNQKIKIPEENEQEKISKLFNILNNLLALYENKQQHLTEIKNTLLNTMFI